ncbi:hypothetical protein ACA910_020747 [Epithemia clementina (nom. ined.)]
MLDVEVLYLLQTFLARLVLEVLGGGGAIWGPAEVLTFRNSDTTEYWQNKARIGSVLFAVRFVLQCAAYARKYNGHHQRHNCNDEKTILRAFQMFSAKLVLDVFGSIGAIWAFAECTTLRNSQTQEFWRITAVAVGIIFLFRFMSQLHGYLQEMRGKPPSILTTSNSMTRLCQVFSAKFVLEVFGGVGAIWGFADYMTWRNEDTIVTWRINALSVGFLFFIRYAYEMNEYIRAMGYDQIPTKPRSPTGLQLKEAELRWCEEDSCSTDSDDQACESTVMISYSTDSDDEPCESSFLVSSV